MNAKIRIEVLDSGHCIAVYLTTPHLWEGYEWNDDCVDAFDCVREAIDWVVTNVYPDFPDVEVEVKPEEVFV